MTDQVEPKVPETTTEEPAPTGWADVKKTPQFQEVAAELNAARAQLEALQSAKDSEAAEKQRKDLEGRQEYDTIVAQLTVQMEKQKLDHEIYVRHSALENQLVRAGVVDPIWLRGAQAGLGDQDIDTYVEVLKKESAAMFDVKKQTLMPPSGNTTPHTGGETEDTEALLANGDPATMARVLKELLAG